MLHPNTNNSNGVFMIVKADMPCGQPRTYIQMKLLSGCQAAACTQLSHEYFNLVLIEEQMAFYMQNYLITMKFVNRLRL